MQKVFQVKVESPSINSFIVINLLSEKAVADFVRLAKVNLPACKVTAYPNGSQVYATGLQAMTALSDFLRKLG